MDAEILEGDHTLPVAPSRNALAQKNELAWLVRDLRGGGDWVPIALERGDRHGWVPGLAALTKIEFV
jgi:hypothetical protein